MNCLVHSFELGLNWGGGVCKFFQKLGAPQAPMVGTPIFTLELSTCNIVLTYVLVQ